MGLQRADDGRTTAQTEKVLGLGATEQLPGQLLERSRLREPWIDRDVDPQALMLPPKASEAGVEQAGDLTSEQCPKELLSRVESWCLPGRERRGQVSALSPPARSWLDPCLG
jgi:hypothetical protein